VFYASSSRAKHFSKSSLEICELEQRFLVQRFRKILFRLRFCSLHKGGSIKLKRQRWIVKCRLYQSSTFSIHEKEERLARLAGVWKNVFGIKNNEEVYEEFGVVGFFSTVQLCGFFYCCISFLSCICWILEWSQLCWDLSHFQFSDFFFIIKQLLEFFLVFFFSCARTDTSLFGFISV